MNKIEFMKYNKFDFYIAKTYNKVIFYKTLFL